MMSDEKLEGSVHRFLCLHIKGSSSGLFADVQVGRKTFCCRAYLFSGLRTSALLSKRKKRDRKKIWYTSISEASGFVFVLTPNHVHQMSALSVSSSTELYLQAIMAMTWTFLLHKPTCMTEDDAPHRGLCKCLRFFCFMILIPVHMLWNIYLQRLKWCKCCQTLVVYFLCFIFFSISLVN